MEPIKIYIPISQIATITGFSKYGSLVQMIFSLWMKIDFEGYNSRILYLENKFNKSYKQISEWEKLQILSEEFGISDLKNKTSSAMKNSTKTDLSNDKNNIINEINKSTIQNNTNIEEIENKKKTLTKLVNNLTNRGYGIKHEDSVIDIYSNLTSSSITEQQKTIIALMKNTQYSNKLKQDIDIEWYLKGKIDGMATTQSGEQIVVEIKNRIKCLFGVLKDYEKPQIQLYLKLMKLNHGHLVEHIKDKKESSTNIIDVYFEEDYWKIIKKRFNQFIIFFHDFLQNKKLQEIIIIKGQHDEETELHFRQVLEQYF
jgi:hypothetical protein